MPTDAGVEIAEDSSKAEGTSGDGANGKPAESATPAGVSKEDFDLLKADNARLAILAEKSSREAAQSNAYMQEFIARTQAAANQVGTAVDPDAGQDVITRFNENPSSVLDEHFYQRMRPLVEQNLQIQAGNAYAVFEQGHKGDEDFELYKNELAEWMKPIPLDSKTNPRQWEEALNFVKAKHLDEIVQRRIQKQTSRDKAAFVEGPSAIPGQRAAKVELSDDQKAIARGLGMGEDDYIKWMKEP